MGHYDKAYDEMAEESRRLTKLQQSRCEHMWKPALCNEDGKITVIVCELCQLNKEV